jgi:hypothetical protein
VKQFGETVSDGFLMLQSCLDGKSLKSPEDESNLDIT